MISQYLEIYQRIKEELMEQIVYVLSAIATAVVAYIWYEVDKLKIELNASRERHNDTYKQQNSKRNN